MSQEIKPILHVKLPPYLSPSKEEFEGIQKGLNALVEGQYFVLVTALADTEESSVEVLSPYKENGEVPQQVLDWMKEQTDGTETGL